MYRARRSLPVHPGATRRACMQWSQELDASKPVLLYCLRGKDIGRSTVLALRARGMDARYIVGGIEAWQAAGLPLQTPGGAA